MEKPYAVEVIADSSGKWCGNAKRYETEMEAVVAADDLWCRWTAVRQWRVVEHLEDGNKVVRVNQLR